MNESKDIKDTYTESTLILSYIFIGIGVYIIVGRIIPQPWNYGNGAYIRGIFLLIPGLLLLLLSKVFKDIEGNLRSSRDTYTLVGVSGVIGSLLILSEFYSELSVGNDWGNFQLFCLYPIWAFFVLLSLIHLFNLRKHNLFQSFLPVLINIIFILAFIISTNIFPTTNLGFRWKLDDYKEVIYLVNNNLIQLDSDGFGDLPKEYKYLSDGGKIWVVRRDDFLDIMFYEHRGILGEYRGTVFSPDGSPPIDHNSYICDILEQIQSDNPYWYECTST